MKEFIWKWKAYRHMKRMNGWASWNLVGDLLVYYGVYCDPRAAVEEDLNYLASYQ